MNSQLMSFLKKSIGLTVFSLFGLPFLFSSAQANPPDNLWALGMTGGGGAIATHENFFHGAKEFQSLSSALNIQKNRSFNLFGFQDSSTGKKVRCYAEDKISPAAQSAIFTYGSELIKTGKCQPMADWVLYYLSIAHVQTQVCEDTSNKSKIDPKAFTGYADRETFESNLNTIVDQGKKGDHVILKLVDHGFKGGEDGSPIKLPHGEWGLQFGSETEILSTKDLDPYIKRLKEKGITAHLVVHSCFSGGFATLTSADSPSAGACVTTMAGKNELAKGNTDREHPHSIELTFDRHLAEFGDQLRSHACSLAFDPDNHPITSLDEVIDRSKVLGNHSLGQSNSCGSPNLVDSFDGVFTQNDNIASSIQDQYKEELRSVFKKYFVDAYQECTSRKKKPHPPDPIFGHQTEFEKTLDQKLKSCLLEKKASLPNNILEPGGAYYLWFLSSKPQSDSDYFAKVVEKHTHFIQTAKMDDLKKYRNALCCLTYNFKTGEHPEICN
jgi:hypothetical protein